MLGGNQVHEPQLLNMCYRGWGPQLLKPTRLQAGSLQQEKPLQ